MKTVRVKDQAERRILTKLFLFKETKKHPNISNNQLFDERLRAYFLSLLIFALFEKASHTFLIITHKLTLI